MAKQKMPFWLKEKGLYIIRILLFQCNLDFLFFIAEKRGSIFNGKAFISSSN